MIQKFLPWFVFAAFTVIALVLNWQDAVAFEAHPAGKAAAFASFAGFLAFTIYCSARENFFGSVRKIAKLHWGRQAGLDLYVGLFMHIAFLCATGVSAWTLVFWAVPFLLFGNLATLLYLAIHFDAIARRIAGA